ncbi:UDP-N-acetylmuramoyl-L-alanine--D-glutamate ligase [Wolbachia endosymbiont of Pentidionis agamae]|uniref:UDP-N-acetylmuramoyl-L-alanine--D-glutamate ligase n=1 Tax=Wolbachia endosymbiont of Pentidionis agamae TaxID=3110435 RepID=UPI002FD5D9E4
MQALDQYKSKSIAVFGLGKTGLSAINNFMSNKVKVYAWDDNKEEILKAKEIHSECNFLHPQKYNWQEIVALILSPGIPILYPSPHWVVKLARKFNCLIKSDIELFLEIIAKKDPQPKIIGVTGTNGKSTTTSLIGHILQLAGKTVDIGGNLGNPVLNFSLDKEIYVIELSSFQLDLMSKFSIDIAVLLNITPDHLDRYENMEKYIEAKFKLISNSKVAVIGYDNEITFNIFNNFIQNKIPISIKTMVKQGISLIGNNLFVYGKKILINKTKIDLASNAENIAAAYAVCSLLRIDSDIIINGITSFIGLRHRNEMLGKIRNVLFINDSKATNAESTKKGILSYKNIYWIVGGRSKKEGIEPLKSYFQRIKKAFLIGESTDVFADTLKNKVSFVKCGNLKNAFNLAYQEALHDKKEATIFFSPACASFDQWRNFEERGESFCKMFATLKAACL